MLSPVWVDSKVELGCRHESEQQCVIIAYRSGGAEKIQFECQSKQLDSQLHTFQDLLQEEMRATKQHPKPPVAVSPPPSSRGGVDSTDYGGDHLGHIQTQGQLSSNRLEEAEMQAEELVELERYALCNFTVI